MSVWTACPQWPSLAFLQRSQAKTEYHLGGNFFFFLFFGNFLCIPLETIVFSLWHQVRFPPNNDTRSARRKSLFRAGTSHTVPTSQPISLCLWLLLWDTGCIDLTRDTAGLQSLLWPCHLTIRELPKPHICLLWLQYQSPFGPPLVGVHFFGVDSNWLFLSFFFFSYSFRWTTAQLFSWI